MLFGTAFHALCQGEDADVLKYERPVEMALEVDGTKCILFGTIDEEFLEPFNRLILIDNKTTQASSFNYPTNEGYIRQLNIYRFMLRGTEAKYNTQLSELWLRYFIKDFSPARTADPNYPRCAMVEEKLTILPEDEIEAFIAERFRDHIDNPERPCTPDEMSFGGAQYAIVSTSRKNAVRVLNSIAEAQAFFDTMKPELQATSKIEARCGMMCKWYCSVKSVCPYAKAMGY